MTSDNSPFGKHIYFINFLFRGTNKCPFRSRKTSFLYIADRVKSIAPGRSAFLRRDGLEVREKLVPLLILVSSEGSWGIASLLGTHTFPHRHAFPSLHLYNTL
ncbi:Hypothetical predicted protein [Podarcis lilfordi]|uniref:Uncharacterized protein n=1 Tax=Podarcis lilfordi TaxID=74358 RepID=A0AA35L097_9SAUR|nr:Hypothetical predicted protein [Podarcis lilfordi]